jgi:hypothetical protein
MKNRVSFVTLIICAFHLFASVLFAYSRVWILAGVFYGLSVFMFFLVMRDERW